MKQRTTDGRENLIKFGKIGFIVMLMICLLDMPYGYYQLVRSIGLFLFLLFAIIEYKKHKIYLSLFYLVSAIIINPVFKVALGRTIWNVVDVFWALILAYTIFKEE